MQAMTTPSVAHRSGLAEELQLLASVEATDADFVSCYLDLRPGIAACDAYLRRQARHLRSGLRGTARLDFENALDMVRARLVHAEQLGWPGLAVFARSLAGGHFLTSLPLSGVVENRVTRYRVPDVLPLVAMADAEAPFTMMLVRKGGLQVLDVDAGVATPRAWAAYRKNAVGHGEARSALPGTGTWPGATGCGIRIPEGRLQIVRRVLAGSNRPLLVAGEGACLDEVVAALPRRAVARLVGCVQVPDSLGEQRAVGYVIERRGDAAREHAARIAARLVRAVRAKKAAVAGRWATLEALSAGNAETLVVATGHAEAAGLACTRCGPLADELAIDQTEHGHGALACGHCGSRALYEWRTDLELVRQAVQQQVPVVVADSDDLRYVGGVGCLLKTPDAAVAARQAFDMVA